MTTSTLDITEARRSLTSISKRLRADRVIWVTRHNKKVFGLVDLEVLEALLETVEILSDQETASMLQASMEDIRAGRLYDHEDVKRELL